MTSNPRDTADYGTPPEVGGIRLASAGRACDNDGCSVLVYNPDGPRRIGNPVRGCPGCGQDGFDVRFGIGLDSVTPPGVDQP